MPSADFFLDTTLSCLFFTRSITALCCSRGRYVLKCYPLALRRAAVIPAFIQPLSCQVLTFSWIQPCHVCSSPGHNRAVFLAGLLCFVISFLFLLPCGSCTTFCNVFVLLVQVQPFTKSAKRMQYSYKRRVGGAEANFFL